MLFNETSRYWFGESANTDGKVEKLRELVLGLLHPEENTGYFLKFYKSLCTLRCTHL